MTVTNPRIIGPTGSVTVRGRFTDIGLYIDPGTGIPVIDRMTTVAINLSEVSSIIQTNETFKNWTVVLTSPSGDSISGRLVEPMVNRGLGYLQSQLIKK